MGKLSIICYNKRIMAQKKKPKTPTAAILNRRASFDYQLGEELKVGVQLNGKEVRAARDGHVQLKGSFVTIRNNELWLNNASFSLKLNEKGQAEAKTVDTSARKLLATRKQIDSLSENRQAGMSIIPLKLLTRGRFIKLVIALGKGKRNYDKRHSIKKRDQERDIKRNLDN